MDDSGGGDGGDEWSGSSTGIVDEGNSEEECCTVGELLSGDIVGERVKEHSASGSTSETGSLRHKMRVT